MAPGCRGDDAEVPTGRGGVHGERSSIYPGQFGLQSQQAPAELGEELGAAIRSGVPRSRGIQQPLCFQSAVTVSHAPCPGHSGAQLPAPRRCLPRAPRALPSWGLRRLLARRWHLADKQTRADCSCTCSEQRLEETAVPTMQFSLSISVAPSGDPIVSSVAKTRRPAGHMAAPLVLGSPSWALLLLASAVTTGQREQGNGRWAEACPPESQAMPQQGNPNSSLWAGLGAGVRARSAASTPAERFAPSSWVPSCG